MNEILDEDIKNNNPANEIDKKVLTYAIALSIILTIVHFLAKQIPEDILAVDSIIMLFGISIFILFITIYTSVRITKEINIIDSSKKEFIVGVQGASVIFYAQIIYISINRIVFLGEGFSFELIKHVLISSTLMSLIGFVVSYYVIHKIREKSTTISLLIGLAYLILSGILFNAS